MNNDLITLEEIIGPATAIQTGKKYSENPLKNSYYARNKVHILQKKRDKYRKTKTLQVIQKEQIKAFFESIPESFILTKATTIKVKKYKIIYTISKIRKNAK
jgi:outer membrane lipoprotein-sorting protein